MIGHVGGDGSDAAAIKLSDSFFPIAAAIRGPLKRKLYDVPRLAKIRGGFQGSA
jgi:hypothetical protein